MPIQWTDEAWNDYTAWMEEDRKTLRKINKLITEIQRNPYSGTGHPEKLRYSKNEYWSRHIDEKNRIVYFVKRDGVTVVVSCKTHYKNIK